MEKLCKQCEVEKDELAFHKRLASPDGLAYICKPCVNLNSRTWREKNPNAHKNWYEKNKEHKSEYFKLWRTADPAAEKQRVAKWAKENPHKVNALIAKRAAVKIRAVPGWADQSAIRLIYERASRMRRETGLRYEVDHIVPLQGKTVCGLHCEDNLQIILKFDNISKLNRHWPDMPTESVNAKI